MKTRYTVALSMIAGAALGAAAIQGLHAQAKPPVYAVAEITVKTSMPTLKNAPCSGGYQKLWRQAPCCWTERDIIRGGASGKPRRYSAMG